MVDSVEDSPVPERSIQGSMSHGQVFWVARAFSMGSAPCGAGIGGLFTYVPSWKQNRMRSSGWPEAGAL